MPQIVAAAVAESALAATAATAATTTAAAAAPTLAAAAVPTLTAAATPLATTAATELGTTAALEAGKQGIIQGGADVMAQEAAKQVAQEGIMTGAKDAAQNQVIEAFSKGTSDLSQLPKFTPEASNAAPQLVPKGPVNQIGSVPNTVTPPASTTPTGLQSATTPSPVNPGYESAVAHTKDVETAAKVGKEFEAAQAAEKYANMNPLEKGFSKAKEFAGDVSKFSKDHPYITAGGIMLAQNMMQPSYSSPPKKKYGSSGPGAEYTAPSATRYTSKFDTTSNYAVGGPVEQMSAENAISGNMMYPQSQLHTPMYSNPMVQRPMPSNVINAGIDAPTDQYTGEQRFADGGNVTGSGNLNLNVPLKFGGPGIGGANGYATAGGEQAGTGISQGYTPAPAQQIDASASPAAANTQSALANAGRAFVPKVQWGESPGVMAGLTRPTYTVGDSAADAYVKANAGSNLNLHEGQADRAKIEELYQKYYRGYADGGSVQGYASGGKMSAFERMMKEEKERQEAQAEAAQAAIEKGKSIAGSGTKPYSRTQSTNSPYAASVKELQAMGKKYGIPIAAPAKTNTDLMGDQDQIEYAANGGIMHGLGGYSDGGRLLKGPGDGVSDSIPAVIGNKQPARLADGEFVIPARIVSELGNGSTEAGARKLYAMMERVQKQRGKTVGKGKVAVNSKADKHLPA